MKANIFIFRWIAQDNAAGGDWLGSEETLAKENDCAQRSVSAEAQRQSSPLGDQALALARRILTDISPATRQGMGLFLGATRGSLSDDRLFQRSRRADGGKYPSPAAFRRTLPSTVAAEMAIAFGLQGPLMVYAGGAASGAMALLGAVRWLRVGSIGLALAGTMDERNGDANSIGLSPSSGHGQNPRQTLLVLLGRADALSGHKAVAKITRTELRASPARPAIDHDQSWAALVPALQKPGTTVANIQLDSGLGTLCRISFTPP